jgi:hypothetical protein
VSRAATGARPDLRDPAARCVEPVEVARGLGEIRDQPRGDHRVVVRCSRESSSSRSTSRSPSRLTAAILAGVDEREAGIGSAVNNAVARVAELIATVAVGALVAAQFSSALDHKLAGTPLTPRGNAAVAQAKQQTLGRPSVAGLPAHEAAAITVASGQSSLQAFRVGIGVAGALVILGGLIGAVGIRNPRRIVHARQRPGGQLAGAPLGAAGLHA